MQELPISLFFCLSVCLCLSVSLPPSFLSQVFFHFHFIHQRSDKLLLSFMLLIDLLLTI